MTLGRCNLCGRLFTVKERNRTAPKFDTLDELVRWYPGRIVMSKNPQLWCDLCMLRLFVRTDRMLKDCHVYGRLFVPDGGVV